jgi:hypothetical protein
MPVDKSIKCSLEHRYAHNSSIRCRAGSCSSNPYPIKSYENDSSGTKGKDILGMGEFKSSPSAPKLMSIETPPQKGGGFMDELASGCAGIEALFNGRFEVASEIRRLST